MTRADFNRWTRATDGSWDPAAARRRVGQPLPALYHVLDARGAVLHETADSHRAYRLLVNDERARAKVAAHDHAIVYAHRRGAWTEASTARAAQRLGAT